MASTTPGAAFPIVQHLCFNEDNSAFVCSTTKGFQTCHTDTAKVLLSGPAFPDGGAKIAQMIQREGSCFVALVGDGKSTLYPSNKVLVWSEAVRKFIIELGFKGKVLNLCLRHDRIVVVMQTQLHVYTFSTRPEKLCVIETGNNPQGLCALSQLTAAPIVAFPVRDEGSLQITNLGSSDGVVVNAHHNALVCFALNADATRLATASAKGTCIRIFDTRTGDSVREVRRGIEHSLIRCMSFYTDSTRLLVASDKEDKSGTIHMFSLSNDDSVQNKHSKLFGLRSVLPSVFSSEWSFCQFHLDSPQPAQRSAQAYRTVCAFGPDKDTFIVVGYRGTIYRCSVDPKSKHNCKLLTTANFT